MLFTIKNDKIRATISSLGAELIQLFDSNNINRMHEPSIKSWNKVSPVLFPQISRMRDLKYKANGQEYHMPAHGFFRNLQLSPFDVKDDEISFEVKSDENSKKMYPYDFIFSVTYKLIDNKLKVIFKTKNVGDNQMYYMVGGHPGFKIPLYENEKYEDYYLKFQYKENVDAMQVVDGYLDNVFKKALNNEDIICLNHDIFNPDAIVLKNLKSSYVDILSKKNDNCIRFHFEDFEILAIWSMMSKEANFVCLEPWNGIQKDFVIDHEKMGILSLKPQEEKTYSFVIEVI